MAIMGVTVSSSSSASGNSELGFTCPLVMGFSCVVKMNKFTKLLLQMPSFQA